MKIAVRDLLRVSKRHRSVYLALLIWALLGSACRVPHITIVFGPPPTSEPPMASASPTAESLPPPRPSEAPTPMASPSPRPTATIVHRRQPGEPVGLQTLWDATCQDGPAPIVPPRGDDYFINLYERPFNAETQNQYYPALDIRRATIGVDETWLYVSIELNGPPRANTAEDTAYGVELDLDIDGRGEWLLWAQGPLATTWQVTGVSLYQDQDEDVGEVRACRNDPPQDGTSYETRVFFAGQGSDPDTAWVRWVPGSHPRVQFALLYDIIERDPAFMWWVWSDRQVRQPTWMDYHDHFTAEEAGSPFPSNMYFPARALARLDNTCHWVFGFTPHGDEPCICAGAFPTPTPTRVPTTPAPRPGRIIGRFYKDRNANGQYDPGEGVSGMGVEARAGTCGSPGAVGDSAISGADGSFVLQVPAGTWCVIPDRTFWSPPRSQVEVPSGGTTGEVLFRYSP